MVLNLYDNKIGSEGALYLANALENNTVRQILLINIYYILRRFEIGSYDTEPLQQPYR